MKALIINGPNLNLLKKRDKNHYGSFDLRDIENLLHKEFKDDYFEFFQSNLEGEIINQIQKADGYFDGIVINPAGYSHTSVAIRDALQLCKIPKIEVHLSNLAEREDFRQKHITAGACDGFISGFKQNSYLAAMYLLKKLQSA